MTQVRNSAVIIAEALREQYESDRQAYIDRRTDFIEALRSKNEVRISQAAAACTHAFNVSEKSYRFYLGER